MFANETYGVFAWNIICDMSQTYHIGIETVNQMQERADKVLRDLYERKVSDDVAVKELYHKVFSN